MVRRSASQCDITGKAVTIAKTQSSHSPSYNRPYSSPAVTAAKTQFSHSPSYNRPYSSPAVTAAKTQFSHSPSYSRPYSSPAVTTPAVDNEKVLTFERGSKERENVVKVSLPSTQGLYTPFPLPRSPAPRPLLFYGLIPTCLPTHFAKTLKCNCPLLKWKVMA